MPEQTQHSLLTGASLHEPKGVATAVANRVYLSNGTASGSWSQIPNAALNSTALQSTLPTAGIGYATGAGGAVTQETDITTAVTLNKVCGTITTQTVSAAIGIEHAFVLNNSNIAVGDIVLTQVVNYAGGGYPLVACTNVSAGSCVITITNIHNANALSGTMTINFAVIKAVSA